MPVTSQPNGVAEVRLAIDCQVHLSSTYAALGLFGTTAVASISSLAPALQLADRSYMVPYFTSLEYLPALAAICEREQIGLVCPLIDPDIFILAAHRAVFEATGAHLLSGSVNPRIH